MTADKPPHIKKRKMLIRLGLSLVLSCVLVWYVGRPVDTERLFSVLANIEWSWVGAMFLCFAFYQYLRLRRISLLSETDIPSYRGTLSLSVQSTINSTLPAGLGEVSLVYILQRLHGISWQSGTSSLIIVRLWDLAVFSLFFIFLLLAPGSLVPPKVVPFMLVLIATLALAALFLAGLMRWNRKSAESGISGQSKIQNLLHQVLTQLRQVQSLSLHLKVFGYTLVMWITMFVFRVLAIWSLNIKISLIAILWIYIVPIELLPVKGIANIGTFEATWYLVLRFFDYPEAQAALLAFGTHIVIFLVRIVSSTVAALLLWLSYQKEQGREHAGQGNTP